MNTRPPDTDSDFGRRGFSRRSTLGVGVEILPVHSCPPGELHLQSGVNPHDDDPVGAGGPVWGDHAVSQSHTVNSRWNAIISDFRRSGVTQADFCRQRNGPVRNIVST